VYHPRVFFSLLALAALLAPSAGIATASAAEPSGSPPATTEVPPFTDVPFYGADALRSWIELGPGPTSQPQLAWEHLLPSSNNGDPILVGGRLIVADQDGDLIALDARTGEESWRATGDGPFSGDPAASAGIVVAADASSVDAFDAVTGAERWTRDVVSEAPRIEISDGVVYVGTVDGAVRGLDLQTGADRWSWQGDHDRSVRVDLVADGVVYANPDDGQLLAIQVSDGSERWRFQGKSGKLGYKLAGETIFVTNPVNTESGQLVGQIAAIDAATGRVRWRFDRPSGNQVAAGPFRDGILYVSSHQDGIYALRDEGDTYSIVWHTDAPMMYRALTLVGDTLYGATADGTLLALNAADGTILWSATVGGTHVLPVVSGGMIFAADPGGDSSVRAFADADVIANLRTETPTTRPSTSPSASPALAALPNPFTIVDRLEPSTTGLHGAVSLAFGPDGNLFVAQTTPRITVLSPNGDPVRSWGAAGAGPGELDFGDASPSIAVSPNGLVYVTEAGNHRVSVFKSDGTFVRHLGSFGDGPGQFLLPFETVVGVAGDVYVTDDIRQGFSQFDASGDFIWRSDPSVDPRLSGHFHRGALDHEGRLWLTNDDASLVMAFDEGNRAVDSFDARAAVDSRGLLADFGPCGVALDDVGNAFVGDCGARAIAVFDPQHHLIGWAEADGLPFGGASAFGPDGRLYGIAGGNRAPSNPDEIVVMQVSTPDHA
jgi:outer membrane protein assembly factor BamB